MKTPSSTIRWMPRASQFGPMIPALSVVLSVFLYMGLWRQIWFDELLHFAFGGMTFEYAIKTIDYTTTEVNHGQTGVYFLLNWILLQIFGASAVALRSPSFISAAVMMLSAIAFLRSKGFGWKWQTVAVVALSANSTLMFFSSEARPYMPMAASALAMLAYYSLTDTGRRTWWGRAIGGFGFIFGAIIHPYWILMWGLIATFSYVVHSANEGRFKGFKESLRFLAPRLTVVAFSLYLLVGQLTWMRRLLHLGADRESIYDWSVIRNSFVWSHFSLAPSYMPIRSSSWPTLVSNWMIALIVVLVLITLGFLLFRGSCRSSTLIAPVGLIGVGLAASLIVTFLSYRSAYFILERQWVGGMAVTTLGITWFFAEWWRANQGTKVLGLTPLFAYLTLVSASFAFAATSQVQLTLERQSIWESFRSDERSVQEFVADPGAQTYVYDPIEGYEYMANVNVARGGPVWEEFVAWYNKWAGMRPEFRESNPGWTRFMWPDEAPQSRLCIPQLCQ